MLIWFLGGKIYPSLYFIEKKIYAIAILFLLGVLKILLFDFSTSVSSQDKETIEKSIALQNRFNGALAFLKKTAAPRHTPPLSLYQLPWFLLLGPMGAGKTTLLTHSGIDFILQRQTPPKDNTGMLLPSDQCDWWVTSDINLIDIPGRYLTQTKPYATLWPFFLSLIKKRAKKDIAGIVIALPLTELIQQEEKSLTVLYTNLVNNLKQVVALFRKPIPCQIIITKCDLLPGFSEFFSEISKEESLHAWGISLASVEPEKLLTTVLQRFHLLIKRINQQLITRLHHERNPLMRPAIKDFPLQLEKLKEKIIMIINHFIVSQPTLHLHGIYLSSAIQPSPVSTHEMIEVNHHSNQELTESTHLSYKNKLNHSYFIKHLITQIIPQTGISTVNIYGPIIRRLGYTIAAILILLAGFTLGKDFQKGIKHTYDIQTNFTSYQLALQQIADADDRMHKALHLLNSLSLAQFTENHQINMSYLLSFYSYKANLQSNKVYHQALNNILLPEIKYYLNDYLKNPVNRDLDSLYAALKSYLMLGDTAHFKPDFIASTIKQNLSKSFTEQEIKQLHQHLRLALNTYWHPMILNSEAVEYTQKYIGSMPTTNLSYVILKNMSNNNDIYQIKLIPTESEIFESKQLINQLPTMYTAKSFYSIFSEQIPIAAEEAVIGNWVLGDHIKSHTNSDSTSALIQQLQTTYVTHYIDTWETLVTNIHLTNSHSLAEADTIICELISNHSPLLQFLQVLHDNTYFEPITTLSPKLETLGALINKNQASQNTLYQIFNGLQTLHQSIQTILQAKNEKQAAYETLKRRLLNQNQVDPITQLRLIATNSPEPLKNWLNTLTNDVLRSLMHDASLYLDLSWQQTVVQPFQLNLAMDYPFNDKAEKTVDQQKFLQFFGQPGILMQYYQSYLQPLVDSSKPAWQWKTIDNLSLPFSPAVLSSLQQAASIQQTISSSNESFSVFLAKYVRQFQLPSNLRI